jgi:MarR family transcriptional regulator, organic hydroperoxide resistance regulator
LRTELLRSALQAYGRALAIADPIRLRFWDGRGLTMPQLRLMYIVRDNGPCSVGEIAERLGVRPATITGFTDRLVRQELIVRQDQPGDRRIVQIALTPEGVRVLGEIEVASRAYFDAIFERMDEDDVRLLVSLLQKLADTAARVVAESGARV